MTVYTCVNGQSWIDVALNTYQSIDQYVKLLNDNGLEPETLPVSGQTVLWDETIVRNSINTTLVSQNEIKYATLLGYSIVEQPEPSMGYTYETFEGQYTASADNETVITITASQGGIPISAKLEATELLSNQYIFNPAAGTWTLQGNIKMAEGQTFFVVFKKLVPVIASPLTP